LTQDEALALGLGRRRLGYAREVVLRVDGKPMVFARSVTAHASAMGAWRSVQGLGNRPLADVLFRHLGICRAPLEFSQPKRHSPLQRHVSTAWLEASGARVSHAALPARRSVFTRHSAALLVMEVFAADAASWHWPDDAPIRRSNPRKLP
jgi:chorismate--pyruvate lyase